jgi:hypothetical protein
MKGDIMEVDWSDADILYFSNVCFTKDSCEKVADLLLKLKRGSRVITLKEMPQRTYMEAKAAFGIRMSWGVQKTFVYQII